MHVYIRGEMIINLTTEWHATKYISGAFIICFNDSLACQEIKMDLVSCIYLLIVVSLCVPFRPVVCVCLLHTY